MINYTNALLSDIAYINFEKNIAGLWVPQSSTDFESRGITKSEVDFFNLNFKVLDQENTSLTGFSGTTFQITTNNVPGYKVGDVIVAYRGTEFKTLEHKLNDILYTDGLHVGFGMGSLADILGEIIDKFGFDVDGLSQAALARKYMEEVQTKYSNITVTGHSLGGYLATYATLTNPEKIKETITFNSAGMSLIDAAIGKLLDKLSAEGSSLEEGLTGDEIKYISEKITHIYSATNLEFTAAGWNPLSTYIGNRIPIYTEDVGMVANHSVIYPRQAMFLYESLRMILQKTIANTNLNTYADITKILDVYKYPATEYDYLGQNHSETERELILTQLTFEKHIKNLATMVGLPVTGSGFDAGYALLNHVYNNSRKLTFNFLPDVNPIKRSNSYNNRSALYALLNYMPFYLTSIDTSYSQKLNVDKYNPLNYSDEFINARFDYFKKAMIAADSVFAKNSYKLGDGRVIVLNTYFSINDGGEEVVYVDVENKIALLKNINDINENILTSSSIKKVYFMYESIPSPSFASIFGKNSEVFDSISNDIIYVKGQNISVYLSKGNDQVHIDVEEASLGLINIMDNGVGDELYFNGGSLDNNINGTKYLDKIRGNDGNDSINGLEGNDILYGGVGADILDGGMGDDTIHGNDSITSLGDISDENYVNIINGGYGIDRIYGGEGKDIINNVATSDGSFIGKHSTDRVSKNYGDIITGGWGDDEIYGTAYGDNYFYYKGDGNDKIIERSAGANLNAYYSDTISFKDFLFTDINFAHNNTSDLLLYVPSFLNTVSTITLTGFMVNYIIEGFIFSHNGYSEYIDYTTILGKSLDRKALIDTELLGNDLMLISHVETLRGLDGTINIIKGGYGKDIIIGGDQDDIIGDESLTSSSYLGNSGTRANAYYGDDVTGGKGNDTIYGTRYADTYRYNKGDGNDIISDHSSRSDSSIYLIDKLILGEGILRDNLIITRNFNNDLILKFEFVDKDNNGQILIKNFLNGYGIEKIVFHDGSIIDSNEMFNQALIYQGRDLSGEVEEILGTKYADTIYGNKGDDKIFAGTGNDYVYGGSGEDEIYGETGDDILNGDSGNDKLDGGYGKDTLNGGEGNDILNYSIKINGISSESYKGVVQHSNTSNYGDILDGGSGNDEIYGTIYGDQYYYNLGDGKDTINELLKGSGAGIYVDILNFGEGINPNEITFERDNLAAILKFKDGGEIRIENFYNDFKIEKFTFLDGTIWDWTHIRDNTPLLGTENTDYLYGSDVAGLIEYIKGFGGNDFLYGLSGINYIDGGDGNDIIGYADKVNTSSNGSSTITGGKGDDELYGSTSTDIYKFNIGDGNDIILDSTGSLIKKIDKIYFGEGIVFEHLVFNRTNHRDLTIHYTKNDSITIKNFYYEDGLNYGPNSSNRRGPSLLEFDDGYVYDLYLNPQTVNIMEGTEESDELYTLYTTETIYAGSGDDKIIATSNYGSSASNYYGEDGNDTITLYAANEIYGGSGIDTITVKYSKSINAGTGNDILNLNGHANNLYFEVGDGNDVIKYNNESQSAILYLNIGTYLENVKIFETFTMENYSHKININYGENSNIFFDSLSSSYFNRIKINAYDGSIYLNELFNKVYGDNNNNTFKLDYIYNATIKASDGNDNIIGGTANQNIYMYGESGDDRLSANVGFNYMNGGSGNDTYEVLRFVKNIVIDDSSGYDILHVYAVHGDGYGYPIKRSTSRFEKIGNDLIIKKSKYGKFTDNTILIKDQFIEGKGIDQIGDTLFRNEIELMIDLMAQYDASTDSTERTQLNSQINGLWN